MVTQGPRGMDAVAVWPPLLLYHGKQELERYARALKKISKINMQCC